MTIRSGKDYREALKVPREVWLGGERVESVLTHPAFAGSIEAVSNLYDLQSDARYADKLIFTESGYGSCATTFQIPRTREDLAARREALEIWARATFGTFGRSPDFFNTVIGGFAAAHGFFGDFEASRGQNVLDFYAHARRNNLFLTRATIAPQVDRSRASFEQADPYSNVRVVRETDAGLIVRGAKLISTNAPIADELLVFPLPGLRPGDEPYALSFCIPVTSPGLKFICRESYGHGLRTQFDFPLSSRFEEIDATCVFDDVLVPWERLFFYGDVPSANRLYGDIMARNHAGHHAMVRSLIKSELMVGVALALAESTKTSAYLHVQHMLGDLLGDLEIVRALVHRAEEAATVSIWGNMCPALEPIQAFRCFFPKANARMVEAIETLGGGGFFSAPSERDLYSPVASDVQRYLKGADVNATDRIHLLKLAWDLSGDAFGQRQMLYEKYHAGDPVRIAAAQYSAYDKEPLLKQVSAAVAPPSVASSCKTVNGHMSVEA